MAPLRLTTYTSPAKPIPAAPGWDPRQQATWPATTATLVEAGGEAILVDALMTRAEGAALDAWIGDQGVRDLTGVYVTHGHADHFFGATELLRRRPSAGLWCRPRVGGPAAAQTTPGAMAVWTSFFPDDQLDTAPRVPEALAGDLTVAGHVLPTVDLGQSDVPDSSVVHVPELGTVVCGDVAYNGIHLWLVGSTAQTRAAWLEALDAVEQLGASTIVAGHRDPDASDDDAGRVLDETRRYLEHFGDVVASSSTADDVVRQMLERHPGLGNPYTLWLAAQDQRGG